MIRGPILNARQRWRAQEHARRVKLLGEVLAEEWEEVVEEFCDASGKIHKERVLQLMESVWADGRKAGEMTAPVMIDSSHLIHKDHRRGL